MRIEKHVINLIRSMDEPLPPETTQTPLDFNDIILQKLEAAQKKKRPPHWEQERKLILDMLEKTQNLVTTAKNTSDRPAYEAQIKALEQEVEMVKQDNARLKGESNSSQKRLIRELEKIEKVTEEKEAFYTKEINKLKERLRISTRNVSELNSKLVEEKKDTYELSKDVGKMLEAKELKLENDRLSRKLKNLQIISDDKEIELSEERDRFMSNNRFITEASINREQTLSNQIRQLMTFNSRLRNDYQSLRQEIDELMEKLKKEHTQNMSMFDTYSQRFEEGKGASTVKGLHEEMTALNYVLLEKDSLIESLKLLSYSNTEQMPSVKCDLSDLHQHFSEINEAFQDIQIRHSQEQELFSKEIGEISNDNQGLETMLESLGSKNFEHDIELLRNDLQKCLLEKNHAKKLIVHYMRAIQLLEIEIKLSKNPETTRLQLEATKLHQQNKELVQNIRKQDKAFNSQVKSLQEVVDKNNNKIRDLNIRIDTLRKNRTKETINERNSSKKIITKLSENNHVLSSQIQYLEAGKIIESYEKTVALLNRKLESSKQNIISIKDSWIQEKYKLKKEIQDCRLHTQNLALADYNIANAIADSNQSFIKSLDQYKAQWEEIYENGISKIQELEDLNKSFIDNHDNFVEESSEMLKIVKEDIREQAGSLLNTPLK